MGDTGSKQPVQVYYVKNGLVVKQSSPAAHQKNQTDTENQKDITSIAAIAAAVIASAGQNLEVKDLVLIRDEYKREVQSSRLSSLISFLERLWVLGKWVKWLSSLFSSRFERDLDSVIQEKSRTLLAEIEGSCRLFDRAHVEQLLPEGYIKDIQQLKQLLMNKELLTPERVLQAQELRDRIRPMAQEALAYEKQRYVAKLGIQKLMRATTLLTKLSKTSPEKIKKFQEACNRSKMELNVPFAQICLRCFPPKNISILNLIKKFKNLEVLEKTL